ncbi:htdX [Scenedesmus sp. PABB004]|nr:htdX [Scenedesmus sp. PABB004]
MDVCWLAVAAAATGLAALAALLSAPPAVPATLRTWPSLGFLYLQIVRSALMRKTPPADLKGTPIEVKLTAPARFNARRYAAFLRLVGYKGTPQQVPLAYPFVESFRLSMLAMAHRAFPFNVLGAVLARNESTMARAIQPDEALTYTASIDPTYVRNAKGHTEIRVVCTAADDGGVEVWRNTLTVIVINHAARRSAGGAPGKPAADAAAPPAREALAALSVPGDAGRSYGALSGDRNPIHLYGLTARLFGFSRPIAHAMYLVARLEAELTNAGYSVHKWPASLSTEFKRPTPLPARLTAVVTPGPGPALACGVVTAPRGEGGEVKDVIVATLTGAK